MYTKYEDVNINGIRPEGWLLSYLKNQRNGLTGHLEVAGFPFDDTDWSCLDKVYDTWWPYEQTGYWFDGMLKCGLLLEDQEFVDRVKRQIEHIIDNSDPDGYLGPKYLKTAENQNRWVHTVFFRAVMTYYEATGDEKILGALTRHYLSDTSPHSELREVSNVEIMLWIYKHTKDQRILDCAEKAYAEFNTLYPEDHCTLNHMASDNKTIAHGVTFNELSKLGAILYIYTGKTEYIDPVINAYKKIDRDCMLADGVMSSSEFLAGKDALDSHETCNIADYTWTLGYLLMATGHLEYADKIEKACFNAAPGAVTSDFKALQYFSCPNQVICDNHSNHNEYYRGSAHMTYSPISSAPCCSGNVNRIMPNYISRMWMTDSHGGITAMLYGPSKFSAALGDRRITIFEETEYPFSDTVIFKVNANKKVEFKLNFRIPLWCESALIYINGQEYKRNINAGEMLSIEREFENDIVKLVLPMTLKTVNWENGGISVERGPLVYAMKIKENWVRDYDEKRSNDDFPAWKLYAGSPWNYAVIKDSMIQNAKIMIHKVQGNPWDIRNAPIEIEVPAKRVQNWEIEKQNKIYYMIDPAERLFKEAEGDFSFTPNLPPPTEETIRDTEYITLVPYGCTKLRITIFPAI